MKELLPALPTHPWSELLENLPEGKGNFYHWGANYTVDPIVISQGDHPSLLLIERSDTGSWALPGGFVDGDETPIEAAKRELEEETRLVIDGVPLHVYSGPVEDPRSTLNAWPETTALLWRVSDETLVEGGDDARVATWIPLGQLPSELYGSHRELIYQAIIEHGSLFEQLVYFGDRSESRTPSGGHMGYTREIISMPHGPRVFMKRHDATRFTDPEREKHSRLYLQREFSVYQQLSGQIHHVSASHALIGDHTLLLDGFDERDGWHWRAPEDGNIQQRYIEEILASLNDLESVVHDDPTPIPPSYASFEHEGWDSFPRFRDVVITNLDARDTQKARQLRDALDDLYARYASRERRPLNAFAHGDMRQSNITWHPTEGVRIVDWSWAGNSAPGLDTTSFLIDLAKNGIDIEPYATHFDPLHALTLIGFWLGHSTWETPSKYQVVRDHQLSSAITAYELLERFSKEC